MVELFVRAGGIGAVGAFEVARGLDTNLGVWDLVGARLGPLDKPLPLGLVCGWASGACEVARDLDLVVT